MQNQMETAKPHSGLGIAACLAGAAAFLISVVLVLIYLSQPNILFRILFIVLLPMLTHLICLLLSLAALFSANRRKLYAGLGAGLNASFFILTIAPWVYFLSMVKLRVL
jgi:hypothetical protein